MPAATILSCDAATSVEPSTAIFAAGCFWGVEHFFKKEVGYIGGSLKNPTYTEVKKGDTEHAEAVRLEYDPLQVDYRTLCRHFFRIHDPTTVNRQGGDIGTQYRSAIFFLSDGQKKIAEETIAEMNRDHWSNKIVTELAPAVDQDFYPAEEFHQEYLNKNPDGYCIHRLFW